MGAARPLGPDPCKHARPRHRDASLISPYVATLLASLWHLFVDYQDSLLAPGLDPFPAVFSEEWHTADDEDQSQNWMRDKVGGCPCLETVPHDGQFEQDGLLATGLPITLAPASHVEDLSHVGSGHSACYDAAASCTAQCTDVTTSGVHRQGSGPINSGSSFSPPPQRSHIAEVDQSFHRVARRPLRSCLKRQTFAAPSPVEVEPHLPSTPPVVHSLKQVRFSFEVAFWFPADDQLNLSLPFKARSAARSLHSSEVCLFKGGSCRTLAGTLPHGQDPSCHFAADFARAHVL